MLNEIKVSNRFGGKWLEIDEQANAIDYLERVYIFLLESQAAKWKWLVIALHGALYSFCILAVQGTNPYDLPPAGTGTVTRKGNKEYLIGFPEVIKRIQDSNIVNPPVILTENQGKRIELLNETLRNNFIHFTPKGQSIELSGMPEIILDSMSIIEHIAIKNSAIFGLDADCKSKLSKLIEDIKIKVREAS